MTRRIEVLASTEAVAVHAAEVTKQIALPRSRLDAIFLQVAYTVTDVGIEAGEDLAGWIKHLKVGEGANLPVEIYSDEIVDLVKFAAGGKLATGHYRDSIPTTATEQVAYFLIEGPFQFGEMANPVVELALRAATDEWAAASAMSATIKVGVIYSRPDVQESPGVYFHRYKTPTNTQHHIPIGHSLVDALYIKTSAAMTKYSLKAAMGYQTEASTAEVLDDGDATFGEALWAQWTHEAYTANTHVLLGDVDTYPGRELWIEMTSGTALVIARNITR